MKYFKFIAICFSLYSLNGFCMENDDNFEDKLKNAKKYYQEREAKALKQANFFKQYGGPQSSKDAQELFQTQVIITFLDFAEKNNATLADLQSTMQEVKIEKSKQSCSSTKKKKINTRSKRCCFPKIQFFSSNRNS